MKCTFYTFILHYVCAFYIRHVANVFHIYSETFLRRSIIYRDRYRGKVQAVHEYIGLLLKGVETARLLQLVSAITFSGSRHSPMKCTDLGGPSLNRHRGSSSRNGSISKFSNSYRLRSWTFSFLLTAVLGKVVASKKTGR